MKHLLVTILLSLSLCTFAQTKKFRGLDDYESWVMNYYKDPQPEFLFDGFNYGVHNKRIAKAGNRSMIIAFYSSCLRSDTTKQKEFYEIVRDTRDEDLIYAFGLTLWQVHSEFSLKLMDRFLGQQNTEKYNADFDRFKAVKFLDIWADSIHHPEHLDMLWADFFATGNEQSVKKIITKLSDLDSPDYFDVATAGSAQWSLASNARHHPKVLDICKREREMADDGLKVVLDRIVESARSGGTQR